MRSIPDKVCCLLCLQVYAIYIGLLLSALNKLPLKLPQNSAGRRHNQKSSNSESITFDDVAGVDEAKEELAEVVVSNSVPPTVTQKAVVGQLLSFVGRMGCMVFSYIADISAQPCSALNVHSGFCSFQIGILGYANTCD